MSIKLHDIIETGTAKFQVVKMATSKDIDDLNLKIDNHTHFTSTPTSNKVVIADGTNGNVVTVDVLPISEGGTGAADRLTALKNLTYENVGTDATYFFTLTSDYGKGGYSSLDDTKTILGLGDAAYKNVINNTSPGILGWVSSSSSVENHRLVNVNTLAYWNGAYTGTNSNLAYCNRGAFGTIVTKNTSDYLATTGGTVSGTLVLSKTSDAEAAQNNSPALIVGGTTTSAHIEIDANEIMAKSNGTTLSTLYLQYGSGGIYITSTGLIPGATNKVSCGASGKVWTQVYATKTAISTSDERKKQQIEDIPEELLDAWEDIRYKIFKFNDSVEEKGENARIHNGVIAQQIKDIFEKHNLDPFKYSFFCYDEWDVHENPKDDTSPIIRKENAYSIRYVEALIIEAAYQRRKNKQLETRIELLERKLNSIKTE